MCKNIQVIQKTLLLLQSKAQFFELEVYIMETEETLGISFFSTYALFIDEKIERLSLVQYHIVS